MKVLEKTIQFLFPQDCLDCGKEDILSRYSGVCKNCSKERYNNGFPNWDRLRCHTCKNPMVKDENCNYCNSRNVFIDGTIVMRPKGKNERNLMNLLKFNNHRILSRFFSLGIGKVLNDIQTLNPKAILPVPSHPSSLIDRPYLATEMVIQRLSRKLKIPIINGLEKISSTKQSSLTRANRFIHAKTAFKVKKKCLHKLPNAVILVDDVFTTGASTNEIACQLKSVGVNQVFQLILLRPIEGIEL